MPFEDRDSGALFSNSKSSPNQPDMRGKITLTEETIEYLNGCFATKAPAILELAGWKKQGRAGRQAFLSLKVQPPRQTHTGFKEFPKAVDDAPGKDPWDD